MIGYIFLSIVLLLLLLSCSMYIQLKPPESVVLVALRMPYQMLTVYLTIGCMAYMATQKSNVRFENLFVSAGYSYAKLAGIGKEPT